MVRYRQDLILSFRKGPHHIPDSRYARHLLPEWQLVECLTKMNILDINGKIE